MPLYELVLITKAARAKTSNVNVMANLKSVHTKLLKSCALHVLQSGGVVREFLNLGVRDLPYRMKRHQQIFDYGSYYAMKFDSNPATMIELQKSLKRNENVIRHTVINMGSSLEKVCEYENVE